MTTKIVKKIVKKIVSQKVLPVLTEETKIISNSFIEREEVIFGSTAKIKPPNTEHAIYITVNFQEKEGVKIPFEVFINCKEMGNHQWITVLTRTLSAIFRSGINPSFILQEMQNTYDPQGGYFYKNLQTNKSEYIPGIVAHIGKVIEHSISMRG